MSDRLSLFKAVKDGGYECAIFTTYTIDFPFYEEVLLRRMKSAGIAHHIVLADARQCQQSLADRPARMAGEYYSLATMRCKRAFHPKLVMLLGKNKGLLAVGSHNLTLSGFGRNLEITNVIQFDKDKQHTLPVFKQAIQACKTWLKDYGDHLPAGIERALTQAQSLCPWLQSDAGAIQSDMSLLYASQSTESLWSQLQRELPTGPKSVTAVSAFFDQQLSFVRTLAEEAESLTAGVQPTLVSAPVELPAVDGVNVVDSSKALHPGNAKRYIHAKMMYVESPERSLFVTGSANLSAPAWLNFGTSANAEAVLIRSDDQVAEVAAELGMSKLAQLPAVTQIDPRPVQSDNTSSSGVALHVVAFDSSVEMAEVNLGAGIPGDLVAGYLIEGDFLPVKCRVTEGLLSLPVASLLAGEVLCVLQGDELLARVIFHNTRHIEHLGATGIERKMRQALGSLTTDAPEITWLFDCIDVLTTDKAMTHAKVKFGKGHSQADKSDDDVESLIEGFDPSPRQGKLVRSRIELEGDAGLVLDVLIQMLASPQTTSNRGLNEDAYGRNEEDLANAGDGGDEVQEGSPKDKNEELAKLCAKKLNRTLSRLECVVLAKKVESLPAALAVLGVTHRIWLTPSLKSSVTKDWMLKVLELLAQNLLKDNDPLDADGESLYATDEWQRLLGYLAWLAYHCGIRLKGRLPLSASKEVKDLLRWQNACWLYLANRVSVNEQARVYATEIVQADNDDGIRGWFHTLSHYTPAMVMPQLDGFALARSEKAFKGERLLVERGDSLTLASIQGAGVANTFKPGYLEVLESA